jgi:hypothetical protein
VNSTDITLTNKVNDNLLYAWMCAVILAPKVDVDRRPNRNTSALEGGSKLSSTAENLKKEAIIAESEGPVTRRGPRENV